MKMHPNALNEFVMFLLNTVAFACCFLSLWVYSLSVAFLLICHWIWMHWSLRGNSYHVHSDTQSAGNLLHNESEVNTDQPPSSSDQIAGNFHLLWLDWIEMGNSGLFHRGIHTVFTAWIMYLWVLDDSWIESDTYWLFLSEHCGNLMTLLSRQILANWPGCEQDLMQLLSPTVH